MPDGQYMSSFDADPPVAQGPLPYCPPIALVLRGLDITELDFAGPRVSVCTGFLRFLINELARGFPFDARSYAGANPDVEAARLAGDIDNLHDHFIAQGYFERRQPHALPFDACYYATQYEDLAQAFGRGEVGALRAHFIGHGWQEGRAAVPWQRDDADRWAAAAHQLPAGSDAV